MASGSHRRRRSRGAAGAPGAPRTPGGAARSGGTGGSGGSAGGSEGPEGPARSGGTGGSEGPAPRRPAPRRPSPPAARARPAPASGRQVWLLAAPAALAAFSTLAIYWSTTGYRFLLDDVFLFKSSPSLQT